MSALPCELAPLAAVIVAVAVAWYVANKFS